MGGKDEGRRLLFKIPRKGRAGLLPSTKIAANTETLVLDELESSHCWRILYLFLRIKVGGPVRPTNGRTSRVFYH